MTTPIAEGSLRRYPVSEQSGAALLHDAGRLAALRRLAILDTPPESEFDDLATLAAAVLRGPVGAVNFVDDERHFTKAIAGMPEGLGGSVPNEMSLCAATVKSGDGMLIVAASGAAEYEVDIDLEAANVGFYIGAAIHSGNQRVGVVCAFGPEPREVSAEERAALVALARQAEALLETRRHNLELRDLALADSLTGIANRILAFDRLENALAERPRVGREVGVLFCDVDDFKSVNDRFGHEVGDALLCDVAASLRSIARRSDTPARIAGDEFVLVCPHIGGQSDLDSIAARLAAACESQRPLPDGSPPPRISIGAVTARPEETAADVLRRADVEMYGDKADARRPLGS